VDVLQNETSEENAKNFLHTLSAQQAKEMIGQFEQKAKTFEIQAHRLLMIQQVLGQNTSSSSSSFNLSKNSPQKDFQQLYTLSHEIQVKNVSFRFFLFCLFVCTFILRFFCIYLKLVFFFFFFFFLNDGL
jgi:hypothetical protein